jgi:acyl carrier protein
MQEKMSRDEIKKIVAEIFQKRYERDFYEFDESATIASFMEISEKVDSLDIIEFLFDIEDALKINIDQTEQKDATIGALIDLLYNEVNFPKPKKVRKIPSSTNASSSSTSVVYTKDTLEKELTEAEKELDNK